MPCFNQVLLERIGLNSSAFPELAQQQNNKCINLLKAVPDAAINFDFSSDAPEHHYSSDSVVE